MRDADRYFKSKTIKFGLEVPFRDTID